MIDISSKRMTIFYLLPFLPQSFQYDFVGEKESVAAARNPSLIASLWVTTFPNKCDPLLPKIFLLKPPEADTTRDTCSRGLLL